MPASISLLLDLRGCHGRAVTLAPGAMASGVGDELALAGRLAELDAAGDPVRTVSLRVASRDAGAWAERVVPWLAAHGRRVILRSAVVLSRVLVAQARRAGATVVLELAHPQNRVARALLGGESEPAAALLLFAQHLRAVDVEVAVNVAPLLPVVHDERAVEALVRHIIAADLVDGHIAVGRLTAQRWERLAEVLAWERATALARAYGLDPASGDLERLGSEGLRLPPAAELTLRRTVERIAERAGLRVDHCGCPLQCHLDPETRGGFVPLANGELFLPRGTGTAG